MKRNKGFSLAEIMIALLIISIALAAAAPMITKKQSGTNNIWQMGTKTIDGRSVSDVSAISFTGPNLLIGVTRLPNFNNVEDYFVGYKDRVGNYNFLPKTDKLIIFNNVANRQNNAHSFFASSHMSFYNQIENQNPVYAGRLAADKYNLALGIGSLQSIEPNYTNINDLHGAFNIAFGHYSMLTNKEGSFNTAFGYKALQGTIQENRTVNRRTNANVAIGDSALERNNGSKNIAIGSNAGKHLQGNNNIVIGAGAGNLLTGSNNILITTIDGYDPRNANTSFDVKRLLAQRVNSSGNSAYPFITNDDNFAIGVLNQAWEDGRSGVKPPMIQGFTQTRCTNNYCGYTANEDIPTSLLHTKGLIINTDIFNINNSAGNQPIFSVYTNRTSDTQTTYKAINPPCNGAPICIASFNIRSGTYFDTETRAGYDDDGDKYHLSKYSPMFYGSSDINSGNPWIPLGNPVYDLYIGSIFTQNASTDAEGNIICPQNANSFCYNNNLPAIVNESRTDLKDGDVYKLIDVGQGRHSTGLKPPATSLFETEPYGLQIRTVKTAVNFLEEFKETASVVDRFRMNADDVIRCLFFSNYDPTSPERTVDCINTSNSAEGYHNTAGDNYKDPIQALFCEFTGLKDVPLLNGLCDPSIVNIFQKIKDAIKSLFPPSFEEKLEELGNEIEGWLSDARLKNILSDNKAGLKEINKLKVYNYTYKADKSQTPHVGVMAQDLKKVFPNAVKKAPDGYYRIRQEDMFYAMINSVQELFKRKENINTQNIDYINRPISELKKQSIDIKTQNTIIEQNNSEIAKYLSDLKNK